MFTLNTNEIELTPKIEEDKTFHNENEFRLEEEALAYINEKYPDVYGNPITTQRKIMEAVRNNDGQTHGEAAAAKSASAIAAVDEEISKNHELRDILDKEFRPRMEELENLKIAEIEKVQADHDAAFTSSQSPEDQKKLKEESDLKIDDIKYEFKKKTDELLREKEAKMLELRGK